VRPHQWILDADGNPVPAANAHDWVRWFENANNRRVAEDFAPSYEDGIRHDYRVSTVFLGIDHNFSGSGPPLLFETLVFRGKHAVESTMERTATRDEALEAHARALARALTGNLDGEGAS
jgi:hypothetical protein